MHLRLNGSVIAVFNDVRHSIPSSSLEIRIKMPKRFDKLIMLMCVNKIGIFVIYCYLHIYYSFILKLELVGRMESDTPEEWFKLAFDSDEPEEKIEYFDLILECETRDPALWSDDAVALVWNNKGIALTFMGMYEESLDCFEKSLKLNRNDTDVWYNMGVALFNLGRYEEAIDYYNRLLCIDPRNDNAWINKGDVLVYIGRHNEAIECYSKVHKEIELDNKFAIVWNKKGMAYLDLCLYENAAECFSKVLSIDPEHESAIENLRFAMEKAKMKNSLMVHAQTQTLR